MNPYPRSIKAAFEYITGRAYPVAAFRFSDSEVLVMKSGSTKHLKMLDKAPHAFMGVYNAGAVLSHFIEDFEEASA